MTISTLTAITAIIFVSVLPGHAAACSDEIDLMQSQLDTKAAAIMDATRFAREAHRISNTVACDQALAAAQRAISR